jgi:hypothetical protein
MPPRLNFADRVDNSATSAGRTPAALINEIRDAINELFDLVGDLGGGGGGEPVDLSGILASLANKSDVGHVHAIAAVTGLQAALDALTASLTGKSDVGHVHAIAAVTGLQAALDNLALASHTHAIAAITGLQAALDALTTAVGGKAATSHTHAIGDTTNLQSTLDGKALAPIIAPLATLVSSNPAMVAGQWAFATDSDSVKYAKVNANWADVPSFAGGFGPSRKTTAQHIADNTLLGIGQFGIETDGLLRWKVGPGSWNSLDPNGPQVVIPAAASVLDGLRGIGGLEGYGRAALSAMVVGNPVSVASGRLDLSLPTDVAPSPKQHVRVSAAQGFVVRLAIGHATADLARFSFLIRVTNTGAAAIPVTGHGGGTGYHQVWLESGTIPTVAAGATEVFELFYTGAGYAILRELPQSKAAVRKTPSIVGFASAVSAGSLTLTGADPATDIVVVCDLQTNAATVLRTGFANWQFDSNMLYSTTGVRVSWKAVASLNEVIAASGTWTRAMALIIRDADMTTPAVDLGTGALEGLLGTAPAPTARPLPALMGDRAARFVGFLGVRAGMSTPPAVPGWGSFIADMGTGHGIRAVDGGLRVGVPADVSSASAEATEFVHAIIAIQGALI